MGEATYREAAYGYDVAQRVMRALLASGKLSLAQEAERPKKGKGLSAVYQARKEVAPDALRFKPHGTGPAIQVRDSKPEGYAFAGGEKPKGAILGLSQFKGQYEALQADMRAINKVMVIHPLRSPEDEEWAGGKRIFNDGRLDKGGRIYGGWQNKKAADRLHFTIDGEAVCEIDVKGSFVSLANVLFGESEIDLGSDPYQRIEFVRSGPPHMRSFAKELVSALLSSSPKKNRLPKGKKKDGNGKPIPLQKEYNLPKKVPAKFYYNQIIEAFPFIKNMDREAGTLMFVESSIIVKALLSLAQRKTPIVAYPVHDCLICKRSDEAEVIKALQEAFIEEIGQCPYLDVEYSNQGPKIIEPIRIESPKPKESKSRSRYAYLDWNIQDDISLIED